ncbi:MAG: N-acetylmuramoyl-L-alanine amidase [Verrucomicrobiales bacterium]|nr:N-acetylmuramoyl-L-alanine amidase [Verrucomicrobiales bacterium]
MPPFRPLPLFVFALAVGTALSFAQNAPGPFRKLEFSGRPLDGIKVALDVGHTRLSPGAMSARGRGEFLFNLATTTTIARVLQQAGARVILINGDGAIKGLSERGEIANRENADCFLAIHHDSVNDKYLKTWVHEQLNQSYADDFRGYSVFASSLNAQPEKSRSLALAVGAALYDSGLKPTLHHAEPIEGENRALLDERTGVYEYTNLVVLKAATMPSILLECGVIVHREEELLAQDPAYQEVIAHAVVKALSEVFPSEKKGFFRFKKRK